MVKRLILRTTGLLALCYGLFVLVWLGQAVFFFASDRSREPITLDITTAQLSGLGAEGDALETQNTDPQLVFTGLDASVRLVQLEAAFAANPGELEVFYARSAEAGFETRKRVIGVPQNDGSILYALPAGQLAALRLDLGTAIGNRVQIGAITLNPHLPASHYFVPTLRTVLAFLALPLLACCIIYTIIEILFRLRARLGQRRADKTNYREGEAYNEQ